MISKLFENIKVYGRYIKKNNLDCTEYWNKIVSFINAPSQKPAVNLLNDILSQANYDLKIIINGAEITDMNKIHKYVHDDLKIYGNEEDKQKTKLTSEEWNKYHTYLQLVEIPQKSKLDLLNLLLIGYKIGKLLALMELDNTNFFSTEAKNFFDNNKLGTMETYVKLLPEQNEKIESDIQITDLLSNTNYFILCVINYYQSGGAELEPFYSANIEQLTVENDYYRRVIYTGPHQQFVIMSIKPNDDIHMEIHKNHDQFIKIEKGTGLATVGNIKYELKKEVGIIIPAGTAHRIQNTNSSEDLKLYTIYSPAEHPPNLVQLENPNKQNENLSIKSTEQVSESNKDNNSMQNIDNSKNHVNEDDENDDNYKEKYLRYKNKYVTLKILQ